MIAGLILAGGRSSRMGGGDKALLTLGDRPVLSHVIGRFASQVVALALNANGDPTRLSAYALPVLPDIMQGFQGPLAGIHAGLAWAAKRPGATHLATVSGDAPFLPLDLVERLGAENTSLVSIARSADRLHPTCALWSVALLAPLEAFLRDGETRRVMTFAEQAGYRVVDFNSEPVDPFFNINTPDDLATAAAIVERLA
jgi:molybdopterin-guanine dinucleotide biosynthesis protein A